MPWGRALPLRCLHTPEGDLESQKSDQQPEAKAAKARNEVVVVVVGGGGTERQAGPHREEEEAMTAHPSRARMAGRAKEGDLDEIEIVDVFEQHCVHLVRARRDCWLRSAEGKQTEECLLEELAEKKCLAGHFCPSQARRFYVLRDGECSKWAERFAFGPSEESEAVNKNRARKKACRSVVMDLSKCLQGYRKYHPEYVPHSDDLA